MILFLVLARNEKWAEKSKKKTAISAENERKNDNDDDVEEEEGAYKIIFRLFLESVI